MVWPIQPCFGLKRARPVVFSRRWSVQDSIYFAFVSGLTIGYGDLAPKFLLTRVLAIVIGICGVLLTALLAAIAVRALAEATEDREK